MKLKLNCIAAEGLPAVVEPRPVLPRHRLALLAVARPRFAGRVCIRRRHRRRRAIDRAMPCNTPYPNKIAYHPERNALTLSGSTVHLPARHRPWLYLIQVAWSGPYLELFARYPRAGWTQ